MAQGLPALICTELSTPKEMLSGGSGGRSVASGFATVQVPPTMLHAEVMGSFGAGFGTTARASRESESKAMQMQRARILGSEEELPERVLIV